MLVSTIRRNKLRLCELENKAYSTSCCFHVELNGEEDNLPSCWLLRIFFSLQVSSQVCLFGEISEVAFEESNLNSFRSIHSKLHPLPVSPVRQNKFWLGQLETEASSAGCGFLQRECRAVRRGSHLAVLLVHGVGCEGVFGSRVRVFGRVAEVAVGELVVAEEGSQCGICVPATWKMIRN